jgi:deoxycytidylate deaminase
MVDPDLWPALTYDDAELVFGVAAAVGTDTDAFQKALKDHLDKFGYSLNPIRLSALLERLDHGLRLRATPEYDRIRTRMDAGNEMRKRAKRGDLLALYAVSEINQMRPGLNHEEPVARRAHILLTLKHPEEVRALRRIYGPGFFLIGVYSSEEERSRYLMRDKGIPAKNVQKLIQRDQDEGQPFGQRTRDTFYLADVFVRSDEKEQAWRFIDLVFGHSFTTPRRDEDAMFVAYAASLRSAALGRQVGAAIASDKGDVIAVGCNDVPRFGGGLYVEGEAPDYRDHVVGRDSNEDYRTRILQEVTGRLVPNLSVDDAREKLRGSLLLDVSEFGRAVHAEMEALLSCARHGVSPRSGSLYTTTFPCHNCARHIIAAGIRRVVYIEPYAKSRAADLHDDAIAVEESPGPSDKVQFEPFVGIGPRRYFDLFSTSLSSGYLVSRDLPLDTAWRAKARTRVPMLPTSYLRREKLAIEVLRKQTREEDP